MTRRNTMLWLALGALFPLLGGGCFQKPYSTVDLHYGEAYEANKAHQIANPDAGSTEEPGPEGLDPVSAEVVADRYYKGQRAQEVRRAPTVTIGELD